MTPQYWIDKAKERSASAAWKLNSLHADARFAVEELEEAKDQLETAARHIADAIKSLSNDRPLR